MTAGVVERWIKITLCADGEARAGKVVDGSLWMTRKEWAKHRMDKRIKIVHPPQGKVIAGEYSVVSDGSETGSVPPAHQSG